MGCHIEYDVEEEAATGFFESICDDSQSPFEEYNNSDTSSIPDTGHWANNIISSTSGADDKDDEEVVFPLDWYVVFEYKCVAKMCTLQLRAREG